MKPESVALIVLVVILCALLILAAAVGSQVLDALHHQPHLIPLSPSISPR